MFKVALQLYSLKEHCAADLDGTLQKIAGIGFDGVETHSLYGHSAEELRAKLDSHGLACPSMHVPLEAFEENLDGVIADALALGAEFLVIPWSKADSIDGILTLATFVCEKSDRVNAAGLKWLYHNHSHELRTFEGVNFFDIFLDNTSLERINLQADTHWLAHGGANVTEFIRAHAGRIGAFHLKDEAELRGNRIDFAAVLKAAAALGHRWLIFEQESYSQDEFISIRTALENIRNIEKGLSNA